MMTEERFSAVCKAAEQNVKATLDLISVHAEREVRGPQPRATLNPLTALTAAAAWERFLSDLFGAAKYMAEEWDEKGTGHFELRNPKVPDPRPGEPNRKKTVSLPYEPQHLNAQLQQYGVLASDLTDGWEAQIASTWMGVTPKGWRFAQYTEDPDTFRSALKTAQHIRNGVAHLALPQNGAKADDGGYGWYNDAKSKTIQSGHARGITALFVQLIDSSIAAVARDRGWNASARRLPAGWFQASVPSGDRRYPNVEFWGGYALHRVG